LAVGLVLGLSIGGAVVVGVLVGQRNSAAALPGFEELRLKATATHGGETFAVATGHVDEDVEGLFTLDFLTGDLQCFVVNLRTRSIGGLFRTNVTAALNAEKGKKPNYLLVTGDAASIGNVGGQRPAAALCYVVDANSGDVAAFSFFWNKSAMSSGTPQPGEMLLVGKWQARNVNLRQ